MASIEPTDSIDVTDGANPDAVAPSARIWRVSPIRERAGTVAPDYTDNGLDVRLLGDDEDDTVEPTVYAGIGDTTRNGVKRAYSDAGSPALWAEPAPQTYDSAGTSVGTLGDVAGPAGAADAELDLGVASTHSISNSGDFPLIVRPVISIAGARFESPSATLRLTMTTTVDAGTPVELVRDLSYGYGGSMTVALPAVTVAVGGSYQLDAELSLIYRAAIADAFLISVAGSQVVFQVTEYTSAGS